MINERIPRLVFVWVLLAQAFLLFPHMLRTPLLIIPVWLFCSGWRLMIFNSRWAYPSSTVKTVLVITSFVVIALIEKRLFSIEAMVLLLVTAFMLKLLELRDKRDLLISVYLAYFVIATDLLFNQSIISAFYLLISLWLVTTSLVAAYIGSRVLPFMYPGKVAAKLLVFSVPLMLVAFLVFPRLDPLWTLPQPSDSGKTGMTDTLSPGSLSNLAESDELAFRVEFEGNAPPINRMYWRGLVLSEYDGQQWRERRQRLAQFDAKKLYDMSDDAPQYRYRMIMEASQRAWMFPLDGVQSFDASAQLLEDYSLRHNGRIVQRSAWQMVSIPSAIKKLALSPESLRHHLYLPEGQNPQTHALAQQLRAKAESDEAYLASILDYLRNNQFYYTLTPPVAVTDPADDFLFRTKRGFCEHYANAFVILARAAHIPARIVVGYQGGDINPFEQHVTVRQLDAHAWTEVWLEDKGWVSIDPTYAVAPTRIDQGSQQSLQRDPRFLAQSPLSPMKITNYAWIKNLQYRIDQINFLWHNTVLSYQGSRQESALKKLLGDTSVVRLMLLVAGAFILSAALIGVIYYWQHKPAAKPQVLRYYQRFLKQFAKRGLCKARGQGEAEFAAIAAAKYPRAAAQIQLITTQFQRLRYSKMTDEQYRDLLLEFKNNVSQFKLRQEDGHCV